MLTIYHGSPRKVEHPSLEKASLYNDFGPGFYCTEEAELAEEWAVQKEKNGYVNEYDFDSARLKVLDLNNSRYTPLAWLAVLLENRLFDITSAEMKRAKEYITENFMPPYKDCDYIIGKRADEINYMMCCDFLSGKTSYQQFLRAYNNSNAADQFVIKSRQAFERLQHTKATPVEAEDVYQEKLYRETRERSSYVFGLEAKVYGKEFYITDIVEKEINSHDACLR